jgi:hypothetical protein
MKTIEEIKILLDDGINWGEILKDAILQKFGENKLISVCNGVFSHPIGEENIYLVAVIVSNEKLFVYRDISYCGDSNGFDFGLLETNYEKHKNKENVYVFPNALKEFTRKLIYGEKNDIFIEYDFDNELSEEERDDMFCECIYTSLLTQNYDELKEVLKNGKGYFNF